MNSFTCTYMFTLLRNVFLNFNCHSGIQFINRPFEFLFTWFEMDMNPNGANCLCQKQICGFCICTSLAWTYHEYIDRALNLQSFPQKKSANFLIIRGCWFSLRFAVCFSEDKRLLVMLKLGSIWEFYFVLGFVFFKSVFGLQHHKIVVCNMLSLTNVLCFYLLSH